MFLWVLPYGVFLWVAQYALAADQFIVKMKPQNALMADDIFAWHYTQMRYRTVRVLAAGQFSLANGSLDELQAHPLVEYVERDFEVFAVPTHIVVCDRPGWHIKRVDADTLWKIGLYGDGVTVAILDTGVDASHRALQGRVLPGYNSVDGSNQSDDDSGHGTHVAGTIVGRDIGIAPHARILPIKFLDKNGVGTAARAIDAMYFAIKHHVSIINNSWGSGTSSQALLEMLTMAKNHGILVFSAAGNTGSSNDTSPVYPANASFAVAATSIEDTMLPSSNYGDSVHLAAPGEAIYSSVLHQKYAAMTGTSMATPIVSGIAALLISAHAPLGKLGAILKAGSEMRLLPVASQGRVNASSALRVFSLLP